MEEADENIRGLYSGVCRSGAGFERLYLGVRRVERGAASSTYSAPLGVASTSLEAQPEWKPAPQYVPDRLNMRLADLCRGCFCAAAELRCRASVPVRIHFALRIVLSVVLPSVLPRGVDYGEASPSPVYGARLLSGLRAQPSRGFKSRHLRAHGMMRLLITQGWPGGRFVDQATFSLSPTVQHHSVGPLARVAR